MTRSETKGIVPIFFTDVQCPIFLQRDKNMLAAATAQEASFLYDYAISFDILCTFHR
jgi:hypothetical protein